MTTPSRDSVGVIFKGGSVAQLEEIIRLEKKPDGGDMTYSEAARMAIATYVTWRRAPIAAETSVYRRCPATGCNKPALSGNTHCADHVIRATGIGSRQG